MTNCRRLTIFRLMDHQWIEMAALGRPLFTGMLYDCRNDSYIPGVTLWDSDALKEDLDARVKPNSIFNISTSDSISEKSKLLEISSSLKASLLGDLVDVCGSAKYLKDRTRSLRQSRVTLQYGQTVRFEQLTMTHLGQVKYPEVFEQKSATHVVVAVLYGAQAFFVFDKQVQSAKAKSEMEAKLAGVLKNMPLLSMGGESGESGIMAKVSADERSELNTFTCTFYGDYHLKKMPTNFEEAVRAYAALPAMLGDAGEMAVPVRVWLLPLATLDPSAARLESAVSSVSVSEAEAVVEGLGEALRQCDDLLRDPLLHCLGRAHERLTKARRLLRDYETWLRRELAGVLRAVRGGLLEEGALREALQARRASPFGGPQLRRWLRDKCSEAKVLDLYVRSLSRMTTVCSARELEAFRLDPQKETVVSFSFTLVDRDEPYLERLGTYLDEHKPAPDSAAPEADQPEEKPWFCCDVVSKAMREQLRIFTELTEANRGQGVHFIACALADSTSRPGADVHFFHGGVRVHHHLALDVPPPAVVVDLQRSTATLRLPKPPAGVLRYRLELAEREGNPEEQSGPEGHSIWTSRNTKGTPDTWTFSDLVHHRVYLFRYRAVTGVLVGLASKVTQFQTKSYFH